MKDKVLTFHSFELNCHLTYAINDMLHAVYYCPMTLYIKETTIILLLVDNIAFYIFLKRIF